MILLEKNIRLNRNYYFNMKILLLFQLFFIVCNGAKCPKNKWNCYISNECILLNYVCDDYNKLDCKYGEDEDYNFCLKWNPKYKNTISSTSKSLPSTTISTTSTTFSSTSTTISSTSTTSKSLTSTTFSSTSTTISTTSKSLTSKKTIIPIKNKSLFVKRKTYIYIIIILLQLIIIIKLFFKLRKNKEIYISNVYLEPTKLNEMYDTMPEYETVL